MGITPGKKGSVQNLHGTIYNRLVDSGDPNIIYHCHAAPTKEALQANSVWTVWRENLTTGELLNPVDSITGNPKPDNNPCDDVENLTYWLTADPFTAISNSSGDPILNSDNDPIFT